MNSITGKPMIFVTGASRSGTTMVTQMLGRHSAIAGLREMQYFGEFCDPRRDPPDRRIDRHDALAALFARQDHGIYATGSRRSSDPAVTALLQTLPDDAGAAEIFAAAVEAFSAQAGKAVPCEQTPRNIYYARQLLEWYPRARFVHMVRDPRGVMASQKFRWRRRSLMSDPSLMRRTQQLRTWINYHPYTVTQLWKLATNLALELQAHPRFHIFRLEDVIVEPERRVRDMCDFLEVEFEPGMLDIEHINSSHVATASAARGFSREAIDAWRDKLTPDERALAQRRCGELMDRLGYRQEPERMSTLAPLRMGAGYVTHVAGAALVNPRRLWIQGRALLAGRRRIDRPRGPDGPGPGPGGGGSGSGPGHANGQVASSDAQRVSGQGVQVFGLRCADVDLESAARYLVECAADGLRRRVAFVNAHSVNVSMREPAMRQALNGADLIYADGVGMAMAARLQGGRLRHNVNGTDLLPLLCRQAARAGIPIALLGAAPGVVQTCAEVLGLQHPGLEVVWVHHGFVGAGETDRLIEEINRSGAGILLVAMGVPRQECWIMEHGEALQVPVVMGVGGLFDFVSGRVPRAPLAVRRLRMEWLFRLMVEPRRLFARYVLGNPLFLMRACRFAVTGRASSVTPGEATTR